MIPLSGALLVGTDANLKDVITALERGEQGIALVVDDDKRLVGILTDRDVRRALLAGARMPDAVAAYVNRAPVTAYASASREEVFEVMRLSGRSPIPLLDDDGRVIGLESLSSLLKPRGLADHIAVVMAGGRGTRLHPLTLDQPKPMLAVRGKPVLEIVLEHLKAYGFERVYVAVHFERQKIERYFGNGEALGLKIQYLREEVPLGTAGALGLLPEQPTRPFVVMNGDLLTHLNFESLLDHHERAGDRITMCVLPYETKIPYGVVKLDGARVVGMDEKPVFTSFVNAGIYVLSPEVLEMIRGTGRIDMTHVIEAALQRWGTVSSFPIHEYWLDIGQHEDYQRARDDYRPRE